jgi:predicted aminopeptidase
LTRCSNWHGGLRNIPFAALTLILFTLISGCADMRYYTQSARGQLDVVSRRQDIVEMLADETLPKAMRERLNLVLAVRSFAIDSLQLPASGSYQAYADLERDYAVMNLLAAPEFSTHLRTWCYPIIGCATYRGYFDADLLEQAANELRQQGNDVYTGRVAAYSTLGWFDDPILNTVMGWPEYRLVGLIFHELAHHRLYIEDDTVFNESFASAVEQSGIELWYSAQAQQDQVRIYHERKHSRKLVVGLILRIREELAELYKLELSAEDMRQKKAMLMQQAKQEYAQLGEQVTSSSGFNRWFAGELNNAKLGSVAAYNSYVSAFLAMLASHDHDYAKFYSHAERLGKLDQTERKVRLEEWQSKGDVTL